MTVQEAFTLCEYIYSEQDVTTIPTDLLFRCLLTLNTLQLVLTIVSVRIQTTSRSMTTLDNQIMFRSQLSPSRLQATSRPSSIRESPSNNVACKSSLLRENVNQPHSAPDVALHARPSSGRSEKPRFPHLHGLCGRDHTSECNSSGQRFVGLPPRRRLNWVFPG